MGNPGPAADQEQQQQVSAQGLQKLVGLLLLDEQVQRDGQAAAAAAQVCCCHQTRMLPVAPSVWGCGAQSSLLLQMVCEGLLVVWMLMKQLHGHRDDVSFGRAVASHESSGYGCSECHAQVGENGSHRQVPSRGSR